ncbi:MAG TPA: hypothetical protein VGA13_14105 [Acidimicrobiales bacterium]
MTSTSHASTAAGSPTHPEVDPEAHTAPVDTTPPASEYIASYVNAFAETSLDDDGAGAATGEDLSSRLGWSSLVDDIARMRPDENEPIEVLATTTTRWYSLTIVALLVALAGLFASLVGSTLSTTTRVGVLLLGVAAATVGVLTIMNRRGTFY